MTISKAIAYLITGLITMHNTEQMAIASEPQGKTLQCPKSTELSWNAIGDMVSSVEWVGSVKTKIEPQDLPLIRIEKTTTTSGKVINIICVYQGKGTFPTLSQKVNFAQCTLDQTSFTATCK